MRRFLFLYQALIRIALHVPPRCLGVVAASAYMYFAMVAGSAYRFLDILQAPPIEKTAYLQAAPIAQGCRYGWIPVKNQRSRIALHALPTGGCMFHLHVWSVPPISSDFLWGAAFFKRNQAIPWGIAASAYMLLHVLPRCPSHKSLKLQMLL